MTVGPPEERRFGGFTCLFVYLNLVNHGYVCWIGPNGDIGEGIDHLSRKTEGFRNFAAIDAKYQSALVAAARAADGR